MVVAVVEAAPAPAIVVVREYDDARDRGGVEEVERACEVGSSGGGKMCLFTDLLGDPLCRIRHSPAFLMLVSETATGPNSTEIAGLVRGCVKTVVSGTTHDANDPIYAKVGYILGLRVSPKHRGNGGHGRRRQGRGRGGHYRERACR